MRAQLQPNVGTAKAGRSDAPITSDFTLRAPGPHDGVNVHELIAACAPLDPNSLYCNLLQCTHFAATCILAERGNADSLVLQGFISGYCLPHDPQTLFVWQVAIAEAARGQGLGKRMLREVLARPACRDVTQLQTTITQSNRASWALFESFARSQSAPLTSQAFFDSATHFDHRHESELLVTIGPFRR